MKRKLSMLIIVILIVLTVPFIWWYMQSPFSSGLYPEKRAGLVVMEVDEEDKVVPFNLSVRWIKSHPWEKTPVFESVMLFDQEGDIIATAEGHVDVNIQSEQNSWLDRNVAGEIELHINGKQLKEKYMTSYTPIENQRKGSYIIEKMVLQLDGETVQFQMKDTYQISFIPKQNLAEHTWEMNASIPLLDGENITAKGYIFELTGNKGAVLEDILFWLPGMSQNYIKENGLYSFDNNIDDYLNEYGEFEGEPLSLPLSLPTNKVQLYIPFSKEVDGRLNDSLFRVMPYFKLSDSYSGEYYVGGGGSIGPFHRDKKWEELIVNVLE